MTDNDNKDPQIRGAFEKFHAEQFGWELTRPEHYQDIRVAERFRIWQAATEQQAAELKQLKEIRSYGWSIDLSAWRDKFEKMKPAENYHVSDNLIEDEDYAQCHDKLSIEVKLANNGGVLAICRDKYTAERLVGKLYHSRKIIKLINEFILLLDQAAVGIAKNKSQLETELKQLRAERVVALAEVEHILYRLHEAKSEGVCSWQHCFNEIRTRAVWIKSQLTDSEQRGTNKEGE